MYYGSDVYILILTQGGSATAHSDHLFDSFGESPPDAIVPKGMIIGNQRQINQKRRVPVRRQSWINWIFTAALILVLSSNALPRLVSRAAPDAGSTAPSLWVTPLVLDFGPVGVGETSSTLTVTITNNGNATLANFAGGGVNPPFGASQNCAAGVLPGASCQYFFDFSPTATGAITHHLEQQHQCRAVQYRVARQRRGSRAACEPSRAGFRQGTD